VLILPHYALQCDYTMVCRLTVCLSVTLMCPDYLVLCLMKMITRKLIYGYLYWVVKKH